MSRKYELNYLPYAVLFFLLSVAASVFEVLITRTTGSIGQAAVSLEAGQITGFLWIMAALTGAKALFSSLLTFLGKRFGGRVGYKLREGFAGHFLFMPFSSLARRNSGATLSLFSSDLPKAVMLIATETLDFLSGIATMAVSAVFMASLQPLYTLIFFVMFPPLVLMQAAISKPVMKHAQTASLRRAEYNAVVNDSLQNTSTIVANGLERVMEERYQSSYERYFTAMKKRMRVFVGLIISGILGTQLPILFVCLACALSVAKGTMTVGVFLVYTSLADTANGWLTMLSQQLGNMRSSQASLLRLEEAMAGDAQPPGERAQSTDRLPAETLPGVPAIELDGVSFSYNGDGKALSGVSISVLPKEKVAIVGPSGSGKSTVLKLLLGLYHAQEGEIRLFGSAQSGAGALMRAQLAYVPQDSFLLPESIRDNIICAQEVEPADEARLENAARDAGILDFVRSLPGGFDTILAEGGENLSGGQRQRIAIARAFYQNAPILLLDEATAALDPVTEKAILESAFQAARQRSVLLVTHRLEAARKCDRIYVLADGKVAEQGRFDELLQANGVFASLYNKQRKEESHESEE